MATGSVKTTIGKFTYELHPVDAVTGRAAWAKFNRIVRASIKDGGNLNLFTYGTEADVEFFCDMLSAATFVSGGDYAKGEAPLLESVFATHFQANYQEMSKWLHWALEANFGGFTATSKPAS